jgi:hypothetical protein
MVCDLHIFRGSFGFLVRSGLRKVSADSVLAKAGAVVPDGGPLMRLLSAITHYGKSGQSKETKRRQQVGLLPVGKLLCMIYSRRCRPSQRQER